MKLRYYLGASVLALSLAACADSTSRSTPAAVAPAPAATPARAAPAPMTDVIGAGPADTSILTSRGFRQTRTRGATQYWWRDSDEMCVRAVASRGSYRIIQQAQVAECGPT